MHWHRALVYPLPHFAFRPRSDMKKHFPNALACLFAGAILVSGAHHAFADDDFVRCDGTVLYEGVSFQVSETDNSEINAKRELIEEACEQACDGSFFEDRCEKQCEKNAVLTNVTCYDRVQWQPRPHHPDPDPNAHGAHVPPPMHENVPPHHQAPVPPTPPVPPAPPVQ